MDRITLLVRLFGSHADRALSERLMLHWWWALVGHNVIWLRAHPATPPLYSSGVRYQREPVGQEEWQPIPSMLAAGEGDCEDLTAWRAAELLVRGVRAAPVLSRRRKGRLVIYHFRVRTPAGIECPSRRLGMGSARDVRDALAQQTTIARAYGATSGAGLLPLLLLAPGPP